MTVLNQIPSLTVRRTDGAIPLISENDLPPGGHFIDGEFRPSSSGRTLDVVDPCSEKTLAQVAEGTVADVDLAVGAAVKAKHQWGRLTPKERSLILLQIADRVEQHSDLLVKIGVREHRKAVRGVAG